MTDFNPNERTKREEAARLAASPWNHPGPTKLIVEFQVRTKGAGSMFDSNVGAFYTGWGREARENANTRAEVTGLAVYEVSPLDNADEVIRKGPNGVYICHTVRQEFGNVIRDPVRISSLYPADKLAVIAKRAPPTLTK